MTRKFINQAKNVSIIINDNDEGATTTIVGDETKVTDDEIFALYQGFDLVGWINEDELLKTL